MAPSTSANGIKIKNDEINIGIRPTPSPGMAPTRDRLMEVATADEALLRKEVIQPHLPVRLPCYDFTPITDPTFDGSLPKGLGHRLRVLPTFVV